MKTLLLMLLTSVAISNSPLFDLLAGEVPSSNKLKVIDNGILALKERLDLIEEAKHTIEVEYFIYSIDSVGRIFTQALINKARQGVKVRILIDKSELVYELEPIHVLAMKNALPEDKRDNIEVKYYNPASLLQIFSTQFRSHRKLLIADGKVAFTGGRNIADEYYNLNDEYNFLDRDVKVIGPLIKEMSKSFELFWNSKYAHLVQVPQMPTEGDFQCHLSDYSCNPFVQGNKFRFALDTFKHKLKKATRYVTPRPSDQELIDNVQREGTRLTPDSPEITCDETYFYADTPGKSDKHRILTEKIGELVAHTRKSITLESPYFVLYSETENELAKLLKNKVEIKVLTNSLHSTDAVYVAAVFNSTAPFYIHRGLDAYIYKGEGPMDWGGVNENARNGVWGIHSKTAIFDDQHVLIGTYNLDPRSRNLNAEMAIVCKNNPELAKLVSSRVQTRIESAVKLDKHGKPVDGSGVLFDTSLGKKSLYWGIMIPSHIFKLLL